MQATFRVSSSVLVDVPAPGAVRAAIGPATSGATAFADILARQSGKASDAVSPGQSAIGEEEDSGDANLANAELTDVAPGQTAAPDDTDSQDAEGPDATLIAGSTLLIDEAVSPPDAAQSAAALFQSNRDQTGRLPGQASDTRRHSIAKELAELAAMASAPGRNSVTQDMSRNSALALQPNSLEALRALTLSLPKYVQAPAASEASATEAGDQVLALVGKRAGQLSSTTVMNGRDTSAVSQPAAEALDQQGADSSPPSSRASHLDGLAKGATVPTSSAGTSARPNLPDALAPMLPADANVLNPLATPASASVIDRGDVRPQTPLLAQHLAQQLSVAVRHPSQGVTEMALDPVELGRVSMTVTTHDKTVTLIVTADRPETADLMRRHLDVLQQEFRTLGYTTVNLEFGSRQGQAGAGHPGNGAEQSATDAAEQADGENNPANQLSSNSRGADGSLDLRM